MLVTNLELQSFAKEGKYAIGAFNTNNMEITLAVVRAAEELRSPVIISVTPSAIKYAGIEMIAHIVSAAIKNTEIPMALHLDHGTQIEDIVGCIEAGFSSVMMDGSKYELDRNIAITKQAAELAHQRGLSIEGELGKIFGAEDLVNVSKREASMTDPEEAKKFIDETRADALAVSIGNAHGWYKEEPILDFDRLKQISRIVDVPLVLHGASGLGDEDIIKAIALGVTKINIDTELREAFRNGVRDYLKQNTTQIDPRKILSPAMENIYEVVKRKIELFGSDGKADIILRQ